MKKTRTNRQGHSRKTRRMRGGAFVESCNALRKKPIFNPLLKPLLKHKLVVNVEEDGFEIANQEQAFCFGDSFTTCTVIAVVMENNYKVAAHINPTNHIISNTNKDTPKQCRNPFTVLPLIQDKLRTNKKFSESNIKTIYAITSMYNIFIDRPTNGRFTTNIYNYPYSQARKEVGRYTSLNDSNKLAFFNSVFPGKITEKTVIDVQTDKEVQHLKTGGRAHFYIKADGSLDLVE